MAVHVIKHALFTALAAVVLNEAVPRERGCGTCKRHQNARTSGTRSAIMRAPLCFFQAPGTMMHMHHEALGARRRAATKRRTHPCLLLRLAVSPCAAGSHLGKNGVMAVWQCAGWLWVQKQWCTALHCTRQQHMPQAASTHTLLLHAHSSLSACHQLCAASAVGHASAAPLFDAPQNTAGVGACSSRRLTPALAAGRTNDLARITPQGVCIRCDPHPSSGRKECHGLGHYRCQKRKKTPGRRTQRHRLTLRPLAASAAAAQEGGLAFPLWV